MLRKQGAGAQPMPEEYEGVTPSLKLLFSLFRGGVVRSDAQPSPLDSQEADDGR
jgi:hypothetical protein